MKKCTYVLYLFKQSRIINKTETIALHCFVKGIGIIGRVMPRGHSITTWTRRGGRGQQKVKAWSCDKGQVSCKMSTIVRSRGGRGQKEVHDWSRDKGQVSCKMSTIVHSRGKGGKIWSTCFLNDPFIFPMRLQNNFGPTLQAFNTSESLDNEFRMIFQNLIELHLCFQVVLTFDHLHCIAYVYAAVVLSHTCQPRNFD